MNFANIVSEALCFSVIIFAIALVAGCNTTAPVRSSGVPGSSGADVQVGVSGMPNVPGLPGMPAAGSAGTADAPVPGKIATSTPQSGSSSAEDNGVPSTAQSGARQPSAGSRSGLNTGREKTEDEILAEALQELNKRRVPPQPGEGSGGQHIPQAGTDALATTAAEKKHVLDKELEQGFADFDQLMLSEQQAINEKAKQEEGHDDFADGNDVYAESDPAQNLADEPLQTAMVDTDLASVKGEVQTPSRSHSRIPPDLVDTGNDDIIARQLREAAMKEQDPELREKLWDEYRKYKRDLR